MSYFFAEEVEKKGTSSEEARAQRLLDGGTRELKARKKALLGKGYNKLYYFVVGEA